MSRPPLRLAETGWFVETSALVAILLREPEWRIFVDAVAAGSCKTGAFNVFEASLAMASRKAVAVGDAHALVAALVQESAIEIVPFTPEMIPHAIAARERFGRGRNGLNLGDCLSYAAAKQLGLRLLYKGDDFAATDVNDG